MRPAELMLLVGMVQLAARHPRITDVQLVAADTFVDMAEKYFEGLTAPCCLEVIERQGRAK